MDCEQSHRRHIKHNINILPRKKYTFSQKKDMKEDVDGRVDTIYIGL